MAILHSLLAILMIGPLILIIIGFLKGRKQPMTPNTVRPNALIFVVNSTMLYVVAYNLIYFIQELFLVLGKNWIGLTSTLYHNNHGWQGSDPRTDLMQGTGALSIFILGVIMLFLYTRIRHWKSWWAIFALWLAHHGLIQSLPQLSTAPMHRTSDVGAALTYLNLSPTLEIALAAFSILAIIGVSYWFSRFFLSLGHPSIPQDHPFRRFRTVWHAAVLPALIGTILIFPYRIPPIDRYNMTYNLLMVSLPAIFAFAWVGRAQKHHGNEARGRILIMPVVLAIGILLFFQLVLRQGLVFQP